MRWITGWTDNDAHNQDPPDKADDWEFPAFPKGEQRFERGEHVKEPMSNQLHPDLSHMIINKRRW